MKIIYKYRIEITDNPTPIDIPYNSIILKVAFQNGGLCMWVMFNEEETTRMPIILRIFRTGHPIPSNVNLKYIDTCIDPFGFVWHVFQK